MKKAQFVTKVDWLLLVVLIFLIFHIVLNVGIF